MKTLHSQLSWNWSCRISNAGRSLSRSYATEAPHDDSHRDKEQAAANQRRTAAKALAQTSNPVVLKAIESVLQGVGAIFGLSKKTNEPKADPDAKRKK